jgi:hypothetical protein
VRVCACVCMNLMCCALVTWSLCGDGVSGA